jgi:hypothetical protein
LVFKSDEKGNGSALQKRRFVCQNLPFVFQLVITISVVMRDGRILPLINAHTISVPWFIREGVECNDLPVRGGERRSVCSHWSPPFPFWLWIRFYSSIRQRWLAQPVFSD